MISPFSDLGKETQNPFLDTRIRIWIFPKKRTLKILGNFFKKTLFWPGAKVHHYYYDLYAFVKNCAVPIDIITASILLLKPP